MKHRAIPDHAPSPDLFFMRIATWNVNSIRQRLEHLLTWLKECSPDIVCLPRQREHRRHRDV